MRKTFLRSALMATLLIAGLSLTSCKDKKEVTTETETEVGPEGDTTTTTETEVDAPGTANDTTMTDTVKKP